MTEFHNADEVFAYLEGFTNLERGSFNPREYRLERMASLLAAFNHPEQSYRVLHVAGSKGKGSVCSYAESCFVAAGLRTGTYMSPHVTSYLERIRVSGAGTERQDSVRLIVSAGNHLAAHVEKLRSSDSAETLPTTFELLTLLALLVFREAEVDIAVVEVGLGGRLDATNLVAPELTVITTIELEHTDYLGPTLESIAAEKAGIIKPGVPVVLGDQPEEARDVLLHIAAERGSPVLTPDLLATVSTGGAVRTGGAGGEEPLAAAILPVGTDLSISFADGYELSARLQILGEVQARNALVASVAVRTMLPAIAPDVLGRGLSGAWLPGRGELWKATPPLLLDGAHTPQSVSGVLRLAEQLEPEPAARVLIYGSVSGKNYREMLKVLAPGFAQIIISRPGTFKKSNVDELMQSCLENGAECSRCDEMETALAVARAAGPRLIVVTGSFHLVGEARRILKKEEEANGEQADS